eukprot:scaffold402151_cov19-Prasinocladus_malaysianus.AAC.1
MFGGERPRGKPRGTSGRVACYALSKLVVYNDATIPIMTVSNLDKFIDIIAKHHTLHVAKKGRVISYKMRYTIYS